MALRGGTLVVGSTSAPRRRLPAGRTAFIVLILVAIAARFVFFELVSVRGITMASALLEGDIALVQRLPEPQLGDVVLIESAGVPPLLRRIVALPGDTVSAHEGVLTRGGQAVESERLSPFAWRFDDGVMHRQRRFRETLSPDAIFDRLGDAAGRARPRRLDLEPVEVPAGHYFVLCDNRVMCPDTRDDGTIGPGSAGVVSRAAIRGVATHLMWYGGARLDPVDAPVYGAFIPLGGRASTTWPTTGLK